MKILRLFLVFFMLMSMPFFAETFAETPKSAKPLVLFDKAFNLIAEPDIDYPPPPITHHPHVLLSVWGWSKDGKVAITTFYQSESEEEIIEASVLDMVTDKVLWSSWYSYNTYPDYESLDYEIQSDIFYQNFGKACAVNGIEFIQSEFIEFDDRLSFKHNGQTFKVILQIKNYDDEDGPKYVQSYKVLIETQNGIKQIGENAFPEPQDIGYNVYAEGVFISPYSNRALIVIHDDGYNNEELSLFGSHLSVGFSPKKGSK